MTSNEIRSKFLEFFKSKGHKVIPSASLIPENDPSVLFTTAGMQQFKPYYLGKKNAQEDFGSLNVISIQKCVRTSDIDEVGDESHLTFFEMLGNFSFGGYFKEGAIKLAYEFITSPEWMNLKISSVSVFSGEGEIPLDKESEEIWQKIKKENNENFEIKKSDRADNFWGPTGDEGPCGPTTEIYVDGVEVWNIVFNEFYQNKDKTLVPLEIKGVDTGMGLERLAKVVQNVPTIFDTDLLWPIINWISNIISNNIGTDDSNYLTRARRVIADHMRSSVFMINDGITPSNTDRGYVLRRLIKGAYDCADILNLTHNSLEIISGVVTTTYGNIYPELIRNREKIIGAVKNLASDFRKLDEKTDKRLEKIFDDHMKDIGKSGMQVQVLKKGEPSSLSNPLISPQQAFVLYSTYGMRKDKIIKFLKQKNFLINIDEFNEVFEKEFEKHQEISKAGMEQKFKGGLGGHSDMEIKYHTATHLLLAALRKVLGADLPAGEAGIVQKGSNITTERLRFDFNWPEKLSTEQLKAIEDLVNEKIQEKIPIEMLELPKEEAKKIVTTLSFDLSKYGDKVKVYKIGDFSVEFCGGPHVANTGDLAGVSHPERQLKGPFKILKEEASSAGVRRIKAVLE
jgi:alanyl-tRNA synthetase